MFVMRQGGPHRPHHSSGFTLWTWTLHWGLGCFRRSAALMISQRTDTKRTNIVFLLS